MGQQDQESMNFEEIVQKVVNAEAKAGLRSSTIVWDLDAHCSQGQRPSHNTSSKMQSLDSKDSSHPKKPKPKDLKSALSHDNVAEPAKKKNRKDKKKRFRNQR